MELLPFRWKLYSPPEDRSKSFSSTNFTERTWLYYTCFELRTISITDIMNRTPLVMGHPALTTVYPMYLVALSATGLVIIVSVFLTCPALFTDVSLPVEVK